MKGKKRGEEEEGGGRAMLETDGRDFMFPYKYSECDSKAAD